MAENSKTTWRCTNCKTNYAKSFPDSTAISTGTSQDNPVATTCSSTTCSSSQCYGGKPELYEFDNAHDSDSEEESAGDIEVTMVKTCESEGHCSLRKLNEQEYKLFLNFYCFLNHTFESTLQYYII